MKRNDLEPKRFPINLRLFGYGDADGKGAGGDDQTGSKNPDEGGEETEETEGDPEEKKYSQKDIDDAVQKRIAREKRKWQRDQQKPPEATKESADPKAEDDESTQKARQAEERAEAMEQKWTCLEHEVKKDCVDDVLALAKVHMAKEKDLDLEDAIDKVLKKYPQFQDGYEDGSQEEKKGWGQRHGQAQKPTTTVEDEIRRQLYGK